MKTKTVDTFPPLPKYTTTIRFAPFADGQIHELSVKDLKALGVSSFNAVVSGLRNHLYYQRLPLKVQLRVLTDKAYIRVVSLETPRLPARSGR
jgi:hypothetical protein